MSRRALSVSLTLALLLIFLDALASRWGIFAAIAIEGMAVAIAVAAGAIFMVIAEAPEDLS